MKKEEEENEKNKEKHLYSDCFAFLSAPSHLHHRPLPARPLPGDKANKFSLYEKKKNQERTRQGRSARLSAAQLTGRLLSSLRLNSPRLGRDPRHHGGGEGDGGDLEERETKTEDPGISSRSRRYGYPRQADDRIHYYLRKTELRLDIDERKRLKKKKKKRVYYQMLNFLLLLLL